MSAVTEADAAVIRAVFDQDSALSAVIALRWRFRGITDNAKAPTFARIIAEWKPPEAAPYSVTRRRRGRGR